MNKKELMAEYWRRIEEEENKKKEEIAMMTHEEMWNEAYAFIEGLNWLITEDEVEFQKTPSLCISRYYLMLVVGRLP